MNTQWTDLFDALPQIEHIRIWTLNCERVHMYDGMTYIKMTLWKTSTPSPDIETQWTYETPLEPIIVHGTVNILGNSNFSEICQNGDVIVEGRFGFVCIKNLQTGHFINMCLFLSETVDEYEYGIRYNYLNETILEQENITAITLTFKA